MENTQNNTTNDRKEELLEEKKKIEEQLAKLTEKDGDTKFTDLGTDEDDSAHEVEQFEIDTSLVGELRERLEAINEELAKEG